MPPSRQTDKNLPAVSPSKGLTYKDASVTPQRRMCCMDPPQDAENSSTEEQNHDRAAHAPGPLLRASRRRGCRRGRTFPISHESIIGACPATLAMAQSMLSLCTPTCMRTRQLAAAPADVESPQFADELGLGAFIAREVRVTAPQWARLHAEVKQPFCPAAWWRHQLSWPFRLLGCARETKCEELPTGSSAAQPSRHTEPCVSGSHLILTPCKPSCCCPLVARLLLTSALSDALGNTCSACPLESGAYRAGGP